MRLFTLGLLMITSLLITLNDLAELRIPNRLTLLFLIGSAADRLLAQESLLTSRTAIVFFLFLLAARLKNKKGETLIGCGDVKLFGALAVWTGDNADLTLTAAFCLAFAPALIIRCGRAGREGAVDVFPFGPFLLIAGWAVRFI